MLSLPRMTSQSHRSVNASHLCGRSGSPEKSLIDPGAGKFQRVQNARDSFPLAPDTQSARPNAGGGRMRGCSRSIWEPEISAQSAHRPAPPRPSHPQPRPASARPLTVDRAAMLERRRRISHFRRRRRDLLGDAALAIVLMVLALILTPGLGVLAIIEIPVALALIGTILGERRIRKRQPGVSRTASGAKRTVTAQRTYAASQREPERSLIKQEATVDRPNVGLTRCPLRPDNRP
jgi:hypothetical protein